MSQNEPTLNTKPLKATSGDDKSKYFKQTVEHIDITKMQGIVPLVESFGRLAFSSRDLHRADDQQSPCGVVAIGEHLARADRAQVAVSALQVGGDRQRAAIVAHLDDPVEVVPDRDLEVRVEARRGQPLGDGRGVGVDDLADQQLGADRDDLPDHAQTAGLTRVPSPSIETSTTSPGRT